MKIPLNRVVAFFGPYISVLAGAVAAWLVAKLNVLGIPGLDEANLATWISGALVASLTAGLSWLGQSKWLKGHHIELQNELYLNSSVVGADDPVSDEEEFANPPADTPVQPSQAHAQGA